MDAIETHDMGNGIFVEVHYDEHGEVSDPRDNDNLGVMACAHGRYTLGDEDAAKLYPEAESKAELVEAIKENHPGASHFHALWLYDHSGITMRMDSDWAMDAAHWDSGVVGLIFTDDKQREVCGTPEHLIDEVLEAEVNEYASWLEGAVYGYVVKRKVWAQTLEVVPGKAREDWPVLRHDHRHDEVLDSCWGFVGETEYALAEGKAAAQHYVDEAAK